MPDARQVLVYTEHLQDLSLYPRIALHLARALAEHMPTAICCQSFVPLHVRRLLGQAEHIPYDKAGSRDFDILLNVGMLDYLLPLARSNAALILFPHVSQQPPAQFRLLAPCAYTAEYIRQAWQRESAVLRLGPDLPWAALREKERIIFNCADFVAPTVLHDTGHAQMIEMFKLIQQEHPHWELVLAGCMPPGQGAYVSYLMHCARYRQVRFIVNPDRDELVEQIDRAAIYWDFRGQGMPSIHSSVNTDGLDLACALQAGAAPVASRHGIATDLLLDKYNALLYNDLADAVRLTLGVIADLSQWSILSQRAQWTALCETRGTALAQRLLAVLDSETAGTPAAEDYAPWLVNQIGVDQVALCMPGFAGQAQGVLAGFERLRPASMRMADLAADCRQPYILIVKELCHPGNLETWLEPLLAEMQTGVVALAGPKLVDGEGRVWIHRLDNPRDAQALTMQDHPRLNMRREVPWLPGDCLLCSTDLLRTVGDLTMDTPDWPRLLGLAAWNKSVKVVYQPAAHVQLKP